jgi:PAS domain S-box-containing protein
MSVGPEGVREGFVTGMDAAASMPAVPTHDSRQPHWTSPLDDRIVQPRGANGRVRLSIHPSRAKTPRFASTAPRTRPGRVTLAVPSSLTDIRHVPNDATATPQDGTGLPDDASPRAPELSDEGLRLLADALDGFIYDWDVETGVVARSSGFETLLGYTPGEHDLTADWWRSQVHPDDRTGTLAQPSARLGDPSIAELHTEYRVRHREGHYIWVSDRARLVRDARGRLVRMVGITTDITAARRTELERERLRTTAELALSRLAQVLETIPSAIVVTDPDGAIVYANPAAEDILGIPRGEIATRRIDSPLWEISARDGRPVAPHELPAARALRGETVTRYEHLIVDARTKARRLLSVNASPLRDAFGTITGAVSSFVDLTEQVARESALRAAEERFRVAQQLSLDAFTILEAVRDDAGAVRDFRWTFLNPEAERLLRRTPGELLGRRLLEEMPGMLDASELFSRYVHVVETGEPHDIELRYARDGIEGWLRHMTVRLEDGVAVFFSDISPRKAAEAERERLLAAARDAAARTARLQEITSELSRVLAPEDVARVIVRQILEAIGAFAGGVLELSDDGRELVLLHAEGFDAGVQARFARFSVDAPVPVRDVVRERVPVLLESRAEWETRYPIGPVSLTGDDGAWAALPLLVEDRVLGALTLRFQTPRQFSADDRELMMAFAGQCAQALERARLYHLERAARAEADAANKAKSDFLAVMSHELRTPLNAIAGYTQLIAMGVHGPTTPAQRESLERISDAQHHLLGLINQVINLARIEAGAVVYDIRSLDLDVVLRSVEVLVMPQQQAKRITAARAGSVATVRVRADEEKLRQVLLNLLSNAIKFTDTGGRITLEVSTDEARARVHVHDTGRGIPAGKLETIFEPFVQVDPRLTRSEDGAGLGLAISRELARGMGGDLTATSTPGQGSTFTLVLPRDVEHGA